MHIFNNFIFYLLIIFSIFCVKIVNSQDRDIYKNFSKIIIKIEDKKFDAIIAYNTFYKSNPKFAKFKLPFNDDICIGKMILKKLSTFKFMCSSGYTASGTYYPSKNAIDAFGKGTDSNGNKLSFRLEGEDISLKTNFRKIVDLFNNK